MYEEESILGLAIIRRNRGISLEQIAESTKINIRCLRAIEHGDFKKLPGGIYDTSYIKQYCRAIDFDEAELLAYYRQNTNGTSAAAGDSSGKGSWGPPAVPLKNPAA